MTKKLILLFILIQFTCLFALAQSCLLEGIIFTNQQEIDDFAINFPNCNIIEGDVRINDSLFNNITNLDGLGVLNEIEGGLFINNNSGLYQIDGLSELQNIGGDLSIEFNAIKNLDGLSSLKAIEGKLVLVFNYVLSDIEGLSNLNTVANNIYMVDNSALENLDGLSGVTTIGGELFIGNCLLLNNINGLLQLTSVGAGLVITDNKKLENLNGLKNLLMTDGPITISNNTILNSIKGIENINAKNIRPYNLRIFGNPELSLCNLNNICHLSFYPVNMIEIHDNKIGCNSIEELDCHINTISGYVYFDSNQNNLMDENERGIPNMKIEFNSDDQIIYSNQNGKYEFKCDSGTIYNIKLGINPNWTITSDSSYTILFQPDSLINLFNNFGLYPSLSKHDALINISSGQTSCGTDVPFSLRFLNTGTYTENVMVKLNYDSSNTYLSSNPVPDEIDSDNHLLLWYTDSVSPYQYLDYEIFFEIPVPTSNEFVIKYQCDVLSDSMGYSFLLAENKYESILDCGSNSINKHVSPVGEQGEKFVVIDEILTYTIRIPNIETEGIIDITILDTLDHNLDMESFRVVNSSTPVQTSIEGNIVKFDFNQITPVDSFINMELEQEFVSYEISIADGTPDYTIVNNKAYININSVPVIPTNTTENTIVESIPSGISEIKPISFMLQPNPANQRVKLILDNNHKIDHIAIYNTMGSLVKESKLNTIDVSTMQCGVYTIIIKLGNQNYMEKLVVY